MERLLCFAKFPSFKCTMIKIVESRDENALLVILSKVFNIDEAIGNVKEKTNDKKNIYPCV